MSNPIKKRIEKIADTCAMSAEHYPLLENWFQCTAETAREIERSQIKSLEEFDSVALALSALRSDIPIIDRSTLNEGIDALRSACARYSSATDEFSPFNALIAQSCNTLIVVGEEIIGALTNLKILEIALGIGTMVPRDAPEEDVATTEQEKIEQICSAPVPAEITVTLPASDKTIVLSQCDATILEPIFAQREQELQEPIPEEDAAATEQEKIEQICSAPADECEENSGYTVFGIPIEQIGVSQEEIKRVTTDIPDPPKPKKKPNEPRKVGVLDVPTGFTALKVPGFPDDRFMLSVDNQIVDRRTGRKIKATLRHGVEYVKLFHPRDEHGEQQFVEFPLADLISKSTSTAALPLPKPAMTEEKDDTFVYVDWFPGIPARKYKVYASGKVYDTVHKEFIPYDRKNESIRLTDSDIESRTIGVHAVVKALKRQSLVWQAFHKEYRNQSRVYISFRDGNRQNCALDNLYIGRSAK